MTMLVKRASWSAGLSAGLRAQSWLPAGRRGAGWRERRLSNELHLRMHTAPFMLYWHVLAEGTMTNRCSSHHLQLEGLMGSSFSLRHEARSNTQVLLTRAHATTACCRPTDMPFYAYTTTALTSNTLDKHGSAQAMSDAPSSPRCRRFARA